MGSSKRPSDGASGGFEPVDPWKSEYLSSRGRNLPHLADHPDRYDWLFIKSITG